MRLGRPTSIRQAYEEAGLSAGVRRSLNLMLVGNILGSTHALICSGGSAAMIGLATELGAGDLIFGVLAAIPQIAMLMQLPFSVLVNRTHKRKKYMLTLGVFSRALWLLFGLIPVLIPMASKTLQLWTIIFLMGISYGAGAVINVCWFPWMSDLAPLSIRGRWLAARESVVAVASVVMGLVIAYVLDALDPSIRYLVIFLIGGTVGTLDMFCFAGCEEVYNAPPQRQSLFGAFRHVLNNKPFMRLVVMWTAWCFTAQLSGAYLHPYSMNVMGLSFTQITVFSTIASAIVVVLVMPSWSRVQQQFGNKNVMMVTCFVASLTPLFYLMSSPGNIWPTLLHFTIGAAFWFASNMTASNMQLAAADDATRPTHVAVFSCVTALVGNTLGSLSGGTLLEWWNSAGMFTTGPVDRYQVLIILSVVLRFGFTILLVPRLDADNDKKPMDLVRHMASAAVRPLGSLFTR